MMNTVINFFLLGALITPGGPSLQPVENTACEKLKITACTKVFMGYEGKDVYLCFDAQGKEVARAPVDAYQTGIHCSQKRMDSFVRAYQNPCYFHGALPDSDPMALLLDRARLPASVCYNIDRSKASFSYQGASYVWQTGRESGGGNYHGSFWSLKINPAKLDLLQTKAYPFLACPQFQASTYCQWHLKLKKDATSLQIDANDIAPPCTQPFSWQKVFAQLSQSFTTCEAKYFY